MAKILIVTGRLAEPIVRKIVSESRTPHEVDVIVVPVNVIALLSAEQIAQYLRRVGVKGYDYIILPGLVSGSGKVVEEATSIKTVKGTISVYDLPSILNLRDLSILSPDKPADEILKSIAEESCKHVLRSLEERLTKDNSVAIGRLKVPLNPPPIRVAVEIDNVHRLSEDRLIEIVKSFIDKGADIIVLGFDPFEPKPAEVAKAVKTIRREVDAVLALDSPMISEIETAMRSGYDMIINMSIEAVERLSYVDKEVAVSIIPLDPSTSTLPSDASARVELLLKGVSIAKAKGFEKILADAVLEPFGRTLNAFLAYRMFKQREPSIPMMTSIANVAEYADVDSVGVVASMTMLAQEAGISIVLVTERSSHTKDAVREAKIASQMAAIALHRGSPPTNLGISLLILKDKKVTGMVFEEGYDVVVDAVEEERPVKLDSLGIFKIRVNHELGFIEALYIGTKGRILIRGKSAKAIQHKILELGLVSELSHAFYLGRELMKAEIALQLGKNYVQEMPLFRKPKPIKP
ncbi:MAG: dihydropteroate synthase-like protein [Ignisphaera sp.]|nr:dihydropteroate synthase-like protein [Ignisphaera sp.]